MSADNADLAEYPHLDDNLIVLGGSSRNSVRRKYVDEQQVVLVLQRELDQETGGSAISIRRGAAQGQVIEQKYPTAILEKIVDGATGAPIFFCHGARADMTWAAAEYLSRNWRQLRREFGETRPFAICLSFPGAPTATEYLEVYRPPMRLSTQK